jgi:hypothetical protein
VFYYPSTINRPLLSQKVGAPAASAQANDCLTCPTGPYFHALFSTTNHMLFSSDHLNAQFLIRFTSSPKYLKNDLIVFAANPYSGYVTSPGFDGLSLTPSGRINAQNKLTLPDGYNAVMISFERLLLDKTPCTTFLEVYVLDVNATASNVFRGCNQEQVSTDVYHSSAIGVYYTKGVASAYLSVGFLMKYSFHKDSGTPSKLGDGMFNCSVDYYASFQQHLECNLVTECEDGRDETGHCSFSNKECRGLGLASGIKCYFTVVSTQGNINTWEYFHQQCKERGGNLAEINTVEEVSDIHRLLRFGKNIDRCHQYTTGLTYGDGSLPSMYRYMWTGVSKAVLYYPPLTMDSAFKEYNGQVLRQVISVAKVSEMAADVVEIVNRACGAVCEVYPQQSNPADEAVENNGTGFSEKFYVPDGNRLLPFALSDPSSSLISNHHAVFTVCPKKHLTFSFLVCDPRSDCGKQTQCEIPRERDHSSSMQAFTCDNGEETVHYTLVCDFRPDCHDQSDEAFCKYLPCPEMICSNGQCFTFYQRCDFVADCVDRSDEENCEMFTSYRVHKNREKNSIQGKISDKPGRPWLLHRYRAERY